MRNSIFEKIRLYGIKKSIKYGISETKYFFRQKFKNSFSQSGEDLIIDKILDYRKNGFYVDVGAYDPHRFSNTKRFYLRGWKGINIEPNPKNYKKFLKDRKRDINLNFGIDNKETTLSFYEFFPDTLSTFSKIEAKKYQQQGYKLLNELKVKVDTLTNVLNKYAKGENIDFFTIDTEGFDLIVLESNDWLQFRPKIICIESAEHNMALDPKKNNTYKQKNQEDFLNSVGYKKCYDNGLNSIYIDIKNDK